VLSTPTQKTSTTTVLVYGPSPPPPSPPPSPPDYKPMPTPPPPPPQLPPSLPPNIDDTEWVLIAYMSLFGAAMLAASIIAAVYFYKLRKAKGTIIEA